MSSEYFFLWSDVRIFLREGSKAVSSEYFYVIVNFCRQNIFERGFHGGVVRIFLCKSKYLTFVSSEYFWEKVPRWCRQNIVSSPHSSLDARAELRTEISQQASNRIGLIIIFSSEISIWSMIVIPKSSDCVWYIALTRLQNPYLFLLASSSKARTRNKCWRSCFRTFSFPTCSN